MIKLYGYWRSTAAYRVRIALNLLNIDYQSISVHLVKDGGEQHHKAYDELNPSHLVPTLVDGDIELSQSLAIIEYLDECYGQHQLLPQEIAQRAKVRALSQDIACDIHPINNLRVVQHLGEVASFAQEDKTRWMIHWMEVGFAAIERKLALTSDSFCFGDQVTLADICLVAQVYNARRFGVAMAPYPTICAIETNCLALDAFSRAAPETQDDAMS